jgi:hypothetical protein
VEIMFTFPPFISPRIRPNSLVHLIAEADDFRLYEATEEVIGMLGSRSIIVKINPGGDWRHHLEAPRE